MSQKTLKLPGFQPTAFPEENPDNDLLFHNKLLKEIIFGLWHEKKQELEARGWTPQPIHQTEIFLEYQARVKRYKAMDKELAHLSANCKRIKYWPSYCIEHDHNWIERRVNYLATEAYGPKQDGVLMIVNCTSGKYAPNPELFRGF